MRWMLGPLALIAGIGMAQAQDSSQGPVGSATTVLASGEVGLHIETVGVAAPDAATVMLSVQGRGMDDAGARAALDAARGRVQAQLAKLGIAASAIAAGGVNVNEDYSAAAAAGAAAAAAAAVPNGDPASDDATAALADAAAEIPQRASQSLTVTVTDLSKLAAVESVGELLSPEDIMRSMRGRTNYFTTDPKAAYGRAVQIALADARREADAYAAALGYRVVRMQAVSNAKPRLNLPDAISMIGRAGARGSPGEEEMKQLAGSVIAGAQVDYVIAPK